MRKKKHEEHENHERWLVSYADFITLLFAFFVVMYSVSSVNEGKYRVLSESLEAAFKSSNKSMMPIQIGQIAKAPKMHSVEMNKPIINIGLTSLPPPRFNIGKTKKGKGKKKPAKGSKGTSVGNGEKSIANAAREIKEAMASLIKQGLISVTTNGLGVDIQINSNILFPSGSATLSRQAVPILEKIARTLLKTRTAVDVEGFTDNVPINNWQFPSNWELSAARAASVVHLLTRAGMAPQRLAAVGYGEHHPVASNKTPEGRQKNRRVVLVVKPVLNSRLLRSQDSLEQELKRLEQLRKQLQRKRLAQRQAGLQAKPANKKSANKKPAKKKPAGKKSGRKTAGVRKSSAPAKHGGRKGAGPVAGAAHKDSGNSAGVQQGAQDDRRYQETEVKRGVFPVIEPPIQVQ